MKIHEIFSVFMVVGLLFCIQNTYAYTQSYFAFVFKNNTSNNIVNVTKITNPTGSILKYETGPTNMKVHETHHFFLLQNPQRMKLDSGLPGLVIQMSWLLTVKDSSNEKIVCQNRVLGWIKGQLNSSYSNLSTSYWRYDVLSVQNSFDIPMCPFHGLFPKQLPPSRKMEGKKLHTFFISINKDHSITIN